MGMVRRRTRRRTMMVAGGMAYAAGRGANQAQPEPAYEEQAYAPPPPAPPPPAAAPVDPIDELTKLAALHESGALTDDEFSTAKQQILGS